MQIFAKTFRICSRTVIMLNKKTRWISCQPHAFSTESVVQLLVLYWRNFFIKIVMPHQKLCIGFVLWKTFAAMQWLQMEHFRNSRTVFLVTPSIFSKLCSARLLNMQFCNFKRYFQYWSAHWKYLSLLIICICLYVHSTPYKLLFC